ncbi:hypothetical protein D9M72_440770 [compost metagenome]
MQAVADAVHQRRQAARVEKVLHQIFVAAGPDVGDHRHAPAGGIEVFKADVMAGAPRHGDNMDDRVGGTAHRHGDGDGVLVRLARLDALRRQVFPHHVDDAAAGLGTHADVIGIGGRDRGRAGQRHADRFGDSGHGAGRAHRHAGAVAARDAAFDADPLRLADIARAAFVPVLPGVRAGAQHVALVVAAQHRAGWHEDGWYARAGGAHQQARRGLVAAAHQHGTVDGMGADQLFGLHREEVAIEHGCRLDRAFRQRDRRQFDREAARLQDAALDVVDALLEVGVAGIDIRPRIDDGDERLAHPLARRVAHLHDAGAMAR